MEQSYQAVPQAELPPTGKNRISRLNVTFLMVLAVLLVIAVVVGVSGLRHLQRLQQPQDDEGWTIFQMGYEHDRLLLAAETQASWKDLRLRGDIYLSRIALLRDVPKLAGVRSNLKETNLATLLNSVDSVDKLIDGATTPQGRDALLLQLRKDAKPVRDLMIDMSKAHRLLQIQERRERIRDVIVNLVSLEAMLLLLMALSVFVLRISSRLHDADNEKRIAAALVVKNEQLEAERRRADDASRAKSQFLANMSHEIRTPLNGIIGELQSMNPSVLPVANRESLEVIGNASRSLLGIVNGILDLAKIEANASQVTLREFSLVPWLANILLRFEGGASAKGIDLLVVFDERLPETIASDPEKLEQALGNLLTNALKFTEKGSVTLTVEGMRELQPGKAERSDSLRMVVTDTGIGIADEHQASVFEPFRQVDESLTRRYGGTGLGLSIVRKTIEQLQGTVLLASRPGEGTSVTVTVPCTLGEGAIATPAANNDDRCVLLLGGAYATIFRAANVLRGLGWRCKIIASTGLLEAALASPSPPIAAAVADQRFAGDVVSLLDKIGGAVNSRWAVPTILLADQESSSLEERGYVAARIGRKFREIDLITALRPLLGTEAAQASAPEAANTAKGGAGDLSGLGILVVDDDPINRRVMQRLLTKLGVLRVKAASGASEAYPMINEEGFDLVLMDIQMPGIDGYAATRQIRAAGHKELKIVACTAHAFDSDFSRSWDEGMDGHISKPVEMTALANLLHQIAAYTPSESLSAVDADQESSPWIGVQDQNSSTGIGKRLS